jgi:hypothetical protein
MKTSRLDKLKLEMESQEKRLESHLRRILPEAAESGANPFTNSEFNPSALLTHQFHPDAESLLESAQECIRLRNQIGIDTAASVGALFLEACKENGSKNEQRRGPRKLAAALLLAIEHGT